MIGGVGILFVWIIAAAVFISNNKDTEYLNIRTNSKLKDRAKFRGPHSATQSKLPVNDNQEIKDGGEETTTDESEKTGKPDWWASDSVLDARTKERRESVRQVRSRFLPPETLLSDPLDGHMNLNCDFCETLSSV
jgi:hypothetical protein